MKQVRAFAFAMVAALGFGGPAHGHAALAGSEPVDGSTVRPPSTFTLTFAHPVRLTALSVRTEPGAARAVRALPRTSATSHTVAAPALAPGRYALEWRAAAADGHVMNGTVSFTVSAAARGR